MKGIIMKSNLTEDDIARSTTPSSKTVGACNWSLTTAPRYGAENSAASTQIAEKTIQGFQRHDYF